MEALVACIQYQAPIFSTYGNASCISTLQTGLCSIYDNNRSLLGKKNIATINELTEHERVITEGRAEAYQNIDEEETSTTVVAASSRHRRPATPEARGLKLRGSRRSRRSQASTPESVTTSGSVSCK